MLMGFIDLALGNIGVSPIRKTKCMCGSDMNIEYQFYVSRALLVRREYSAYDEYPILPNFYIRPYNLYTSLRLKTYHFVGMGYRALMTLIIDIGKANTC